jgi:saccharopine dehydrogenase (NADP+, L-glutamate forming)
LNQSAIAAGISIVNEVGLDPGIDHMLIMKFIDSIYGRGGTITELVSLCGGLPDPVAADNPLRYKFSWSPKGVLSASANPAKYLAKNKVIEVAGTDLLLAGEPTIRFPTMRLEVLPNRNSLLYKELYNIPDAHSICRGTLRYEGWSNIMYALRVLGVFKESCSNAASFVEFLRQELNASGSSEMMSALHARLAAGGVRDVPSAVDAIVWLGLLDPSVAMSDPASPLESMSSLLTEKLQFSETEKDMVAMYHSVVGQMPDGSVETHSSRLLAFGTPGRNGETAMAATVGYTTAAAAELILNGQFSRPGVSIPITPDLYDPILSRIQNYGITWTEDIATSKKD